MADSLKNMYTQKLNATLKKKKTEDVNINVPKILFILL